MTPLAYNLPTWLAPAFAASTLAFAGLTYASISPANRFWGDVLSHGNRSGPPCYALTFDDGPTPGATDRILDVLAGLGVRATFFVIGINAARSPQLLRRIHADGHLIGNHTWHHSHYGMLRGPRYWRREVERTDALIHDSIGAWPALFRPPMGVKTGFIHHATRRAGQRMVTWNRRAFDGVATTTQRILERLVPSTGPGDVLALHDGIEPHRLRDVRPSVEAVRPLVEGLRRRGLEPQRLDALLGIRGYRDH